MDAASKPLNDGWLFDVPSKTWQCVYVGSSDVVLPTGSLATLWRNRIVLVSAAVGSPKLDSVQSLDFQELRDSVAFTPKMRASTETLLKGLEDWVDTQAHGMELARSPEKLSKDFENGLRKVMDALFQVKSQRSQTDLLIDQLHEAFAQLAEEKVPGINKMEKRLEAAAHKWDEIKKAQPQVKTDVEPIQAAKGEDIKKEIETFAAKVRNYRADFRRRGFFKYATGFDGAYPLLDAAAHELAELKKECDRLSELASVFEFPQAIEPVTVAIK